MLSRIATAARSADETGDARIAALSYRGLKRCAADIGRRLRITDRYRFEDRSTGSKTVVCVLSGHKTELMPFVLPTLAAAARHHYVCVVSPGLYDEALSRRCDKHGWSYLASRTRDAALAQNICYRLHPDAEMIVKIDEGMFVLPGSISALLTRFREIKAESIVDPSVVAPLIPLDGVCYRHLLEGLGLLQDFESWFGKARVAAAGVPIETDPEAALWIWRRTAPLARTAQILAACPEVLLLLYAPVRFSAGMIAFERSYWETIGYFPVYRRRLMVGRSTTGADGDFLSACAMARSRPVVISSRIIAGRFAFERQYKAMLSLLESRPELFRISTAVEAREAHSIGVENAFVQRDAVYTGC